MKTLYGDLETYSEVPISDGTYKYAENCEVMLFLYAFDDGPVHCWDLTEGDLMPRDLYDALEDDAVELVFQNSMFDRNVLACSKNLRVVTRPERWRDTMVQALAHSLPGGLEKLCEVLRIPVSESKIKDGRRLIHLFCKPRPKNMLLRRATRETHPQDWRDFIDYGKHDVSAMRAVDRKLPTWNYPTVELAIWHLDQSINDRGIAVDIRLAEAAIRSVEDAKISLRERTATLTHNTVDSTTQRDNLLAHILAEYEVDLPDLQASTLERRLNDPELPLELRELIGIRLAATTSSTSKYKSLIKGVSADGRLRGLAQFNGANRTGRWAHRMFQPGNIFRPDMSPDEIDLGISSMLAGTTDLEFDNPMRVAANCIRGCIIAPPTKKLVVADYRNVEGRYAAWLAGEEWKLQAFRDYDDGIGPDLYILAYAKSFNVDPDTVPEKGTQRQIGKVEELMLQYQGGVGAWITGAATYGIDLDAMTDAVMPTLPRDVWKEAEEFFMWTVKKKRTTFGLEMDAFITLDALKRLWRGVHPNIEAMWGYLENAARAAIDSQPGRTFNAGRVIFDKKGNWLRMRLPGGRYLCYPSPQVSPSGKITYMGHNQYTRQWQRLGTYGGKLLENATQGGCACLLKGSMPHAELAGYETVLHVHDELVCETPDESSFNADALGAIMCALPAEHEGLPLSVAGFETYRYRKE